METALSRVLPLAASLAAGLVLITGCDLGGGSSPGAAPATQSPAAQAPSPSGSEAPPSPAAPSESAPSVPAAPSGPATPSSPAQGAVFPNAKAAADALVAAWHIGDKEAARKAAGPNTVEKIFAGAVVDTDAKVEGCNPGSSVGVSYAYDCYYRYEGGSTHFYVDPYPPTGWRVVNFTQIAD